MHVYVFIEIQVIEYKLLIFGVVEADNTTAYTHGLADMATLGLLVYISIISGRPLVPVL